MTKASSKSSARYFRPPLVSELVRRFFVLSVAAYFAGFLGMGYLAQDASLQKAATRHIPISPAPFSIQGSSLHAARQIHLLVWHYLTNVPEVCADESRIQNNFQRSQCQEFWTRLSDVASIAVIPFLCFGAVLYFAYDGVRQRFRKARRKIDQGKTMGLGIVTDPPDAAPDRVSWWFGVRPITVQIAGGKQIVAYLPPEASTPRAGDKVTVYDWGKIQGEKRFFAVLYAPHVAVLQGG